MFLFKFYTAEISKKIYVEDIFCVGLIWGFFIKTGNYQGNIYIKIKKKRFSFQSRRKLRFVLLCSRVLCMMFSESKGKDVIMCARHVLPFLAIPYILCISFLVNMFDKERNVYDRIKNYISKPT